MMDTVFENLLGMILHTLGSEEFVSEYLDHGSDSFLLHPYIYRALEVLKLLIQTYEPNSHNTDMQLVPYPSSNLQLL